MPYIHVRTNQTISKEQAAALKSAFGDAISLLPGKSEKWLMVDLEEGATLFLAGQGDLPLAMVEVELLGAAGAKDYERLTAKISDILQTKLNISPSGVYVKYAEVGTWGYNGANF